MTRKFEAGEFITYNDDPEGRGVSQMTYQCCHCGGHWVHEPGSGKLRGFCMSCGGHFCGPDCEACVPTEQLLENIEKGREENFRPTRIYIPPTATFLK